MGAPHIAAAVLGGALSLIRNDTQPGWYAIPEIACNLVTSDRDQWRCDEGPGLADSMRRRATWRQDVHA